MTTMRRVRDTVTPEEVRQVLILDDICFDFTHEVMSFTPPFEFQRIVRDGAPSICRLSVPVAEVAKSKSLFRKELRRIFDEQLQRPESCPVHDVILNWLLDAWSGAMFGPTTTVEVDKTRGVLVACTRSYISRSKLINGIENMLFYLHCEKNIVNLGLNHEFAVFDDKVSVWLGPMRLVGFGCKKCQNTRYIKKPIDCSINLPDGADLQYLATSKPVEAGSVLWTYPGDTYTPSCACPPPPKKPPKIARAKGVTLPGVVGVNTPTPEPQKKPHLKLIYKVPTTEDENRGSPIEERPAKRLKRDTRSPPATGPPSFAEVDQEVELSSHDLDSVEALFEDELPLAVAAVNDAPQDAPAAPKPVDSPPRSPLFSSPEPETSPFIPPRKRLPTPSVSPEPEPHPSDEPAQDNSNQDDGHDMEVEQPSFDDTPATRDPSPSKVVPPAPTTPVLSTSAPEKVPPRSKLQLLSGRKSSSSTPTARGKAVTKPATPMPGAAATPTPSQASSTLAPTPVALPSSQPLRKTVSREPRVPSPLVTAVILSSLNQHKEKERASEGDSASPVEDSEDTPSRPSTPHATQSKVTKIHDVPVEDSTERSTFSPSSPSHAYRERPRMLPPTSKAATPIPNAPTSTPEEGDGIQRLRLSDTPEETLRQTLLQMDWLLATRSALEADKAKAEEEMAKAEAENGILRSITDAIQIAHNAALEDMAKIKEENTKVKEENTRFREENTRFKEENTRVKEESTRVKEESTKAEEENAKAKEDNQKMLRELEELRNFKAAMDGFKEELRDLQAGKKQMLRELEELDNPRREKQPSARELEELRALRLEVDKLRTENQHLKTTKPATVTKESPELLRQLDMTGNMLVRANEEMARLEKRLAERLPDNRDAVSQQLEARIARLDKEKHDLTRQIHSMIEDAEIEQLRVKDLTKHCADLSDQIQRLQYRGTTLEQENRNQKAKIAALERDTRNVDGDEDFVYTGSSVYGRGQPQSQHHSTNGFGRMDSPSYGSGRNSPFGNGYAGHTHPPMGHPTSINGSRTPSHSYSQSHSPATNDFPPNAGGWKNTQPRVVPHAKQSAPFLKPSAAKRALKRPVSSSSPAHPYPLHTPHHE